MGWEYSRKIRAKSAEMVEVSGCQVSDSGGSAQVDPLACLALAARCRSPASNAWLFIGPSDAATSSGSIRCLRSRPRCAAVPRRNRAGPSCDSASKGLAKKCWASKDQMMSFPSLSATPQWLQCQVALVTAVHLQLGPAMCEPNPVGSAATSKRA